MLNLRQFADQKAPDDRDAEELAYAESTVRFRGRSRGLGNIGEPLSFDESDAVTDEDSYTQPSTLV
ncbi:hypothetical protein PsYK624_145910 [Phanerochaete sordida]|uniref:Uncharacterized protein n=1 Tax=Phanerochaete sordida TaxID=48140 RepID=A0A9P3GMX6_9APHY|nr:hypothetical protein PsYK624_145910 [Phanerochaete sordida]